MRPFSEPSQDGDCSRDGEDGEAKGDRTFIERRIRMGPPAVRALERKSGCMVINTHSRGERHGSSVTK